MHIRPQNTIKEEEEMIGEEERLLERRQSQKTDEDHIEQRGRIASLPLKYEYLSKYEIRYSANENIPTTSTFD